VTGAGGGLVEALYCDLRFATPEAKLTNAPDDVVRRHADRSPGARAALLVLDCGRARS
jgi:hypothetical protein